VSAVEYLHARAVMVLDKCLLGRSLGTAGTLWMNAFWGKLER